MEIEKVKELITAFKEAELTSLSLKCEAFELKLKKEETVNINPVQISPDNAPVQSVSLTSDTSSMAVAVAGSPLNENLADEEVALSKKCIKSPIVGTFYHASSPQAQPFVTVGSKVKKGDVVCVIEAMKLMNEVEAEEDGEIIEILVENEEMVEYGQPLFVLR